MGTGIEISKADIKDWTDGGSKDITLQGSPHLTYDANGGTGMVNSSKVLGRRHDNPEATAPP